MTDNTQNPGGWDDLALLGVVQGSNKCRTVCPTMKVEHCRCAAQWSGILAWIAAREAAARREGVEAAASWHDKRAEKERASGSIVGARAEEYAANAIRALPEGGR